MASPLQLADDSSGGDGGHQPWPHPSIFIPLLSFGPSVFFSFLFLLDGKVQLTENFNRTKVAKMHKVEDKDDKK